MSGFRPAHASQVSRSRWPSRLIVYTPLLFATVFAKFSPAGALFPNIGMLFPVVLMTLAIGLLSNRLRFVPTRLALYLLMLSVLVLVQVWRGEAFSYGSLAMMALLGLAYVPAVHDDSVTTEDAMNFFCNLSFAIALAGILQFALQFVAGPEIAFPIEHFVPDALRTHGYNDMAVLRYGSHIYKATGFVMLEPSVFCQLCALGLTAELATRSRGWRLASYSAAIVVSYSGTGLLILAVTLPMLVVMHGRWDLLLRGLLLVAVLALLAEPLNLTVTLSRAGEFNSTGSSAFQRFVGWTELFADKMWTSPVRAMFGYGSGSFFDAAAGYKAGEMAHAKIIFEFGILGALLYFAFIFHCLLRTRAPLVVRAGLLVAYFMNGAYSPTITGFAATLLLWPSPYPPARKTSTSPEVSGEQ
ncbi:MAG: hypothetical protein ACJ8OJ_12860 [Povalibacter sp.]